MSVHRRSVGAGAPLKCVMLCAVLTLGAGCSLQSAYVTRSDIEKSAGLRQACKTHCQPAPTCQAGTVQCAAGTGCGSTNADYTERAFEKALKEHAVFASAIGEVLLPLAGVVAFKAAYDANQHNAAALAAGGFAGYGIGQYLYKKPREEIYLTGVSAIECARRLADTQRLDPDERSLLLGIAGNGDAGGSSASGYALRDDARKAVAAAIDATGKAAVAAAQGKAAKERRDRIATEIEAALTLDQRWNAAVAAALVRVRASDGIELELCRTVDQIRTDVNHMLVNLTPNLVELSSSLAGLKLPSAPAPNPGSSATSELVTKEVLGSDKRDREVKNAQNLRAELKKLEEDAKVKLTKAERLVAAMETQVALDAARVADQESLWEKCGVDKVAKPLPFSLSVHGTVDVAQGLSYQVGIVGGRQPYRPVLANVPTEGSLKIEIIGNAAQGYVLRITPDAKTTTGSYGIVVSDGDAALQSFAVNVIHGG